MDVKSFLGGAIIGGALVAVFFIALEPFKQEVSYKYKDTEKHLDKTISSADSNRPNKQVSKVDQEKPKSNPDKDEKPKVDEKETLATLLNKKGSLDKALAWVRQAALLASSDQVISEILRRISEEPSTLDELISLVEKEQHPELFSEKVNVLSGILASKDASKEIKAKVISALIGIARTASNIKIAEASLNSIFHYHNVADIGGMKANFVMGMTNDFTENQKSDLISLAHSSPEKRLAALRTLSHNKLDEETINSILYYARQATDKMQYMDILRAPDEETGIKLLDRVSYETAEKIKEGLVRAYSQYAKLPQDEKYFQRLRNIVEKNPKSKLSAAAFASISYAYFSDEKSWDKSSAEYLSKLNYISGIADTLEGENKTIAHELISYIKEGNRNDFLKIARSRK